MKSGELVTLQEKVIDHPSTSLREEVCEHVKGIHSRIDKNNELYMSKLDSLEKSMAQVIQHLKISKSTAQSTREDPSTKGDNDQDKDKDGDDKGGESKENEAGKDNSEADKEQDKSKGKNKMPDSADIFINENYDNYPKDMEDDDVFDAAYHQAEEEGHFEESFLFPEEESADPEHFERVQNFKAEHEARKLKLQELQRLFDEKKMTEEHIKLEKQEIWDAACK